MHTTQIHLLHYSESVASAEVLGRVILVAERGWGGGEHTRQNREVRELLVDSGHFSHVKLLILYLRSLKRISHYRSV